MIPFVNMTSWPSGLRRNVKAVVFGRGFESHRCHFFAFMVTEKSGQPDEYNPLTQKLCSMDSMECKLYYAAIK
eukprot:scaffold3375_cov153-Cylindrotheca_fusiformis.AAC.2